MAHAQFSPSSSDRWGACPASVKACEGLPDTAGGDAREGTDAHWLSESLLDAYIDGKYPSNGAASAVGQTLPNGTVVDADFATYVDEYVDYVIELHKSLAGSTLMVEQKLPIGLITGERNSSDTGPATGTADAVILHGDEIIVIDLKFGRGVEVNAERNPQLGMYGLAATMEYELLGDYKTVRCVIVQPRKRHLSEYVWTLEELQALGVELAAAVENAKSDNPTFMPGEKQCRFCRAKAGCKALQAEVWGATHDGSGPSTVGDFDDLTVATPSEVAMCDNDWVGAAMAKVDLIESWCKSIRAEAERRLLAGEPVRGFKLVQGKRGNRQWRDAEEAEATMKAMRVKHDQMYEYKLITPTTAEKLAKAEAIGPRQWPKLAALIVQSEGSPSVAPESDKRPALAVVASADDFDVVSPTNP